MDELQIINLEQTDITVWNFEQIKEELSKTLSVYKSTVYTDETMKTAKQDKATLAKAKKLVEEQRKAYKAKCLAPYDALEPQIKEIIAMIEEQRGMIDGVVKDYTERQKQEKEVEVREYYDKKAFVLGTMADALYEKILDSKWLNISTSKSKYQEEIQIAINQALNDINIIKEIDSPFVETLMEKYAATLSVEEAKAKHEELKAAANKAGLNQNVTVNTSAWEVKKKEIKADAENGVNVKIYANQNQLNQIFDFMKAVGVTYEVQ